MVCHINTKLKIPVRQTHTHYMNRIPFMKAPTTAQTNNDSLFLNKNVPVISTKDPTLKAIEEEVGKIALQHRQFKNETIEEIDRRIQRYGSEMKTTTVNLSNTVSKVESSTAILQEQLNQLQKTMVENKQEPLNMDALKQELMSAVKPTDEGATGLKEVIGKNLNGIRQDIAKLREAAPVYPNYDKELSELKNTVESLRVIMGNMASKSDVNSLFGIVGSMKAPIDELRRTIASTDFSAAISSGNSFKPITEKPTLTRQDVGMAVKEHTDSILSALGKTNQLESVVNRSSKELGDMIAKSQQQINDSMGKSQQQITETMNKSTTAVQNKIEQTHKPLLDKVDAQIKTTKDILDGHQRSLKELLDTNQRSLKEILDIQQRTLTGAITNKSNGGDNLSVLIDNKLNSFYDRIKTDIVIKMSERLDEVLMQTKKLENYFVESRSQFSDSMRGLSKKIDDSYMESQTLCASYMDKDSKEILEQAIVDFMTKNKPELVDGVSNHIAEDMITILKKLEEKFLTTKVETKVEEPKVEPKSNVQKPNPFSPFKKG